MTSGLARRAALAAALVAAAASGTAGCSPDARTSETRRRDVGESIERRAAGLREGDTASLVTPLRGELLIGAARGAGGVATVRTECADCHPGAHDVRAGRGATVSVACADCHESAHEAIQAFYAGAVSGTEVAPDTMFVARVACAGCHADTTFTAADGAPRHAALDAMCTSCHGERFGGMLGRWRSGVAWRMDRVAAYVRQAAADGRLASTPARERVRAGQEMVLLLRTAGPLHNVRGADRLFRAALDSVTAAYRGAGVAAPARPALGPDPARVACLGCHYGIEASSTTAFGERFDHGPHIVRGDVACDKCHSDAGYLTAGSTVPGQERALDPRHGRTTVTAAACASCHHQPGAATACSACHAPGEMGGRYLVATTMRVTPSATRRRELPFRHDQHGTVACASCHSADAGMAPVKASCTSCHEPHHRPDAACTSCHTGAKPLHTRQAHVGCAGCHDAAKVASLRPTRPVCQSCHVDMAEHNPGRECVQCHQVAWRPAARAPRSD